jgi:nitrous oxidase accessory protein NosD
MKRKCLAVGIILLFVGTCIIPATAQDSKISQSTSRGNWLYVGGSGPGNYTRIQDAIDNANDGDIIFVYQGIYNGSITISKSITLLGEARDQTIINGVGSWKICSIYANNVTIKYFTIKNGSYGIWLFRVDDTKIINNLIIKTGCGIWIQDYCFRTKIYFNSIAYASMGIKSDRSKRSYIFYNNFHNNTCNIQINFLTYYYREKQCSVIQNNNFYSSITQATFDTSINIWIRNYWEDHRFGPKIIKGSFVTAFPYPRGSKRVAYQIDLFPATEPFDIP